MNRLVGVIAIFVSLIMLGLTAMSVRSAGGIDILSVASVFVVVLIGLAGIGALRSKE